MDIGGFSTNSPQYMPTFELNRQIVQKAEHYGLDFAPETGSPRRACCGRHADVASQQGFSVDGSVRVEGDDRAGTKGGPHFVPPSAHR